MKKIFGHRGLPNSYPENTFLSLNKALEICDFVETDVRITKDKELILFHDPTLNNQKIEELSLQEISDIKSTDLNENHLTSRDQILGDVNFELKVNKEQESLNTIFVEKIIEITNNSKGLLSKIIKDYLESYLLLIQIFNKILE